jgi:hypothetical protein
MVPGPGTRPATGHYSPGCKSRFTKRAGSSTRDSLKSQRKMGKSSGSHKREPRRAGFGRSCPVDMSKSCLVRQADRCPYDHSHSGPVSSCSRKRLGPAESPDCLDRTLVATRPWIPITGELHGRSKRSMNDEVLLVPGNVKLHGHRFRNLPCTK